MPEPRLREVEQAAEYMQADARHVRLHFTPARSGGEDGAKASVAERRGVRREGEPAVRRVVVDPRQREHETPAGERPRVVVAALDLVPGIAPTAVVPIAHGPHQLE